MILFNIFDSICNVDEKGVILLKQKEKSELTRQRIMAAAMEEFGTHDYGSASMNAICERGALPKGLIYHHFKGKEDLYLACVEEVFHQLAAALNDYAEENSTATGEERLIEYFEVRQHFFSQHPFYSEVLHSATAMPPAGLAEEIESRRAELNSVNVTLLRRVVGQVELREGIPYRELEEAYLVYQDMVNMSLNQLMKGKSVAQQEAMRMCWVRIFLYGIIKS